jgi:stearoyl-CoA desaturase (delta-9 desaturase)
MTEEPVTKRKSLLHHIPTVLVLGVHAGVLAAPFFFTWRLLACALATYVVQMLVITGGYHRYFSHRAYKTSRVFQLVLAWIGASTIQNGPLWWASWHRHHHKHADEIGDAHSPVRRGFWYAHVGWVMDPAHDHADLRNVRDLSRYPELRFIDRFSWVPVVTFATTTFLLGGLGALVWVFAVATTASFHATLFVNSLAHGPTRHARRYDTADSSRNNFWLALLTFGEGWHNNHHRFMCVARQGFRWWEIDMTYYVLRVLSAFGVIHSMRQAPANAMIGRKH